MKKRERGAKSGGSRTRQTKTQARGQRQRQQAKKDNRRSGSKKIRVGPSVAGEVRGIQMSREAGGSENRGNGCNGARDSMIRVTLGFGWRGRDRQREKLQRS